MYDEEAHSDCESENVMYRLFRFFLMGKKQEEAIKDVLKDESTDLDTPKEDE